MNGLWILKLLFFFYGEITPIIFIYLINLKKKYICRIIILKIKNYNKDNNCKITDNIIMGIIVFPFDN